MIQLPVWISQHFVHVMAWHLTGAKPLPEPILTHICNMASAGRNELSILSVQQSWINLWCFHMFYDSSMIAQGMQKVEIVIKNGNNLSFLISVVVCCPGNTRSQGISMHAMNLIVRDYSDLSSLWKRLMVIDLILNLLHLKLIHQATNPMRISTGTCIYSCWQYL